MEAHQGFKLFLHFISSNYEIEDIGFLNPYTNSVNPFELWITRN